LKQILHSFVIGIYKNCAYHFSGLMH